ASLLVAPLVLLMVLETRRLADHRDEHLRFERLYAASSRTGGLQSLPVVMATLAEEARSLVTGAAGACCTVDRDGAWEGVLVDDHGVRPLLGAALDAVLAACAPGEAVELIAEDVPESLGHVVPSMESLVVARAGDEAAAPVVLAVSRHLAGDGKARGRAEVLDAFVGHAALTVANARLYADVEHALAHQVDLNRQKDDFVAVVSHELRTPLTAMIGSVATLQRMDPRLGPDRRAILLDMSLRQGLRLKRLIEELLLLATVEDKSRAQVRTDENVDLRVMVEEIAADLADQRSLRPLPVIQFEAAGPAVVRTDDQKLRQIVANLVENACKYAPGSPVLVRVSRRTAETLVEIVDRGPGIPPADRERVFERFVQLDQSSTRAQGGTGLGLYLCRILAGVLGGTLTLADAAGGGCRFVLTLPSGPVAVEAEAVHELPALAAAAPCAGGTDR
ncbi:MAG TPA: HAMP domain-containing sensor histidine kinase, partial [Acidimicrobiales bacterium]|nr:HAMP domain-containing sensor histidine kinase [Acidimicrobiales bacterium]